MAFEKKVEEGNEKRSCFFYQKKGQKQKNSHIKDVKKERKKEELMATSKKNQKKYARQRIKRGFADEDVWSIDIWFMNVMPKMLKQLRETHVGSPACLGENYYNEKGILVNDTCHQEWNDILDRMIFLLQEMNEETCKKKNPYEDEYMKELQSFENKYGFFGEKLLTEEEKEDAEKTGYTCWHTLSEQPQHQELSTKYMEEEKKLFDYRDACKNEFFELFSKYFWNLWD